MSYSLLASRHHAPRDALLEGSVAAFTSLDPNAMDFWLDGCAKSLLIDNHDRTATPVANKIAEPEQVCALAVRRQNTFGRSCSNTGQCAECPRWVIRVGLAGPRRLPIYPGDRTFSG